MPYANVLILFKTYYNCPKGQNNNFQWLRIYNILQDKRKKLYQVYRHEVSDATQMCAKGTFMVNEN